MPEQDFVFRYPYPKEIISNIVSEYAAGLSMRALATKFQLAEWEIYKTLKKENIKFRPRQFQKGNKWNSGERHNKWKGGISKLPDYHRNRNRVYVKKWLHTQPLYKMKVTLRHRIQRFFQNQKRSGSRFKKNLKSFELIGCDAAFAFQYLELQFLLGMTWDNHGNKSGQWSIDHKIPLATAQTEEELIGLFHYTNLQPLWHMDNVKKGSKLNWIPEKRSAA